MSSEPLTKTEIIQHNLHQDYLKKRMTRILTPICIFGPIIWFFIAAPLWLLLLTIAIFAGIGGGSDYMDSCDKKKLRLYTEEEGQRFAGYYNNSQLVPVKKFKVDEENQTVFFQVNKNKIEAISIEDLDKSTKKLDIRKLDESKRKKTGEDQLSKKIYEGTLEDIQDIKKIVKINKKKKDKIEPLNKISEITSDRGLTEDEKDQFENVKRKVKQKQIVKEKQIYI